MNRLNTQPNVAEPDDIYQRLIDLHAGRSDEESAVINARLILLLVNHIGDRDIILEAIALAGASRVGESSASGAATTEGR
jgi:hypothetical protein